MSERYTPERIAKEKQELEAAHNMVADLCLPRGTAGAREWLMSIPARPDHDPDLVIGTALINADKALAEIQRLNAVLDRLADEAELIDRLHIWALRDGDSHE